jgi:two-component sensor histidine kinase
VRLLTIVCLALLPVSALSVWQGVERVRFDQQSARQLLRESALEAASDELNAFVAAEQLLMELAKEQDIRLGRNACGRRLEDSLRGSQPFDNLARIALDGTVLCAAVIPPPNVDPTKFPWWKQALVRREFFVTGPIKSEALRKDVFLGVLPLTAADGTFDGTLNVAIDVQWLAFMHERQPKLPRSSIVAIFDKSGAIVASSAPTVASAVFAGGAGLPKGTSGVTSVTGPKDEPWSLAIAPVLRHEYYVGFAMPDSELTRLSYIHLTIDLLLPILMILLASLAIWLATDRLVVRWTDTLGRMAAAYGKGHYAIRPQALNKAPREFQVLGATLEDMASAVQERDRSLKEALTHKEMLVKDIHHRVKNTLQIVMSLLNLQSNGVPETEAREALDQGRARISALALAYRAIYELDHLDGAVDLKPLLLEAIEQVKRGADEAHANLTVNVKVASCKVSGDTAIPLLLFANEALTTAYQHGFSQPDAGGNVAVSLQPAGDDLMDLVITDDGERIDGKDLQTTSAIGARLMQALAQQVSGEMTIRDGDGGGTVVSLRFAAKRETAARTA